MWPLYGESEGQVLINTGEMKAENHNLYVLCSYKFLISNVVVAGLDKNNESRFMVKKTMILNRGRSEPLIVIWYFQ